MEARCKRRLRSRSLRVSDAARLNSADASAFVLVWREGRHGPWATHIAHDAGEARNEPRRINPPYRIEGTMRVRDGHAWLNRSTCWRKLASFASDSGS